MKIDNKVLKETHETSETLHSTSSGTATVYPLYFTNEANFLT